MHLTRSSTLILEPVKCGTTWMRAVLTELGIPYEIAPTVIGVCPRHSYAEHCIGTFRSIYCPIRNPYSWLVSYYNYHIAKLPLSFEANVFYPHRMFGSEMPGTFAEFVEMCCTLHKGAVTEYFRPFLKTGPHLIKQECLAAELVTLLSQEGYEFSTETVYEYPAVNASVTKQDWATIPEGLRKSFRDMEQTMFQFYSDVRT